MIFQEIKSIASQKDIKSHFGIHQGEGPLGQSRRRFNFTPVLDVYLLNLLP